MRWPQTDADPCGPDGPAPARGTYRALDGAPVAWHDAEASWAGAARTVLIEVARRYGAWVTYGELADTVQADTGVHTTMLLHHWIGPVLEHVVADQPVDEPPLACFVVRASGEIGAGYRASVRAREGAGTDPEAFAAHQRLACHRHFGAVLPADGGRPTPTWPRRRSLDER